MEGVANTVKDTHVIELKRRCGDAHGISGFLSIGKEK